MTSATFFACRRNWSSTFGAASCAVSRPAAGRFSDALKVAKRMSASCAALDAETEASIEIAIPTTTSRLITSPLSDLCSRVPRSLRSVPSRLSARIDEPDEAQKVFADPVRPMPRRRGQPRDAVVSIRSTCRSGRPSPATCGRQLDRLPHSGQVHVTHVSPEVLVAASSGTAGIVSSSSVAVSASAGRTHPAVAERAPSPEGNLPLTAVDGVSRSPRVKLKP